MEGQAGSRSAGWCNVCVVMTAEGRWGEGGQRGEGQAEVSHAGGACNGIEEHGSSMQSSMRFVTRPIRHKR